MRVLHVVGARPNFMKVAPVMSALAQKQRIGQLLVHTGQHYDLEMSDVFFQQLGIPVPSANLGVGSGSHAQQTAQVISRFEAILLQQRPDVVLVYGDVNSTMAAAIVAAKLLIPVAHVEAGLRSRDRTMPEEINRIVTDAVSDLLLTPSKDADDNLKGEGVHADKIYLVGNVMIDCLIRCLPMCRMPTIGGVPEEYALVTLHRPSNVDDPEALGELLSALNDIGDQVPVIFPLHPRTRQALARLPRRPSPRVRLLNPLGYLEFLALQRQARVVITDSGGVQEETTYLGVPCLTVRENTERPVTIEVGTNVLIGHDHARLRDEVKKVLAGEFKSGQVPPLWDGRAGERVAAVLETWLHGRLARR